MATFPQFVKPEIPTWESVWPANRVTVSQSGKKIVRTVNVQLFAADLVFPPVERDIAQRLISFYNAREGSSEPFDYPLSLWEPLGKRGGRPQVQTSAPPGSNSVTTANWTPNTQILKAGDLFRFQHSKIYQSRFAVTTDATGVAQINIIPTLRQAVVAGEFLVVNGLTMLCRFAQDRVRLEPVSWNYYRTRFRIEEDL